ncbi:MAG: hypothetical protein KAH68_06100 [Draconibacterium sp.]|nr:hypothetical protein [Draconibacterium sp.]
MSASIVPENGLDSIQNNIENNFRGKSISIGITLTHFSPSKGDKNIDYSTNLFDIGFESLFNFDLTNTLFLSTGLHYQHGKIQASNYTRIISGELSIPVIANIDLMRLLSKPFSLSTGFYTGKYVYEKVETAGSKLTPDNDWHDFPIEYLQGYSSEKFIIDFYFGLGYNELSKNKRFFQFNLFAKYRLNEHWLNQHVSKFSIGVKMNYFFKF